MNRAGQSNITQFNNMNNQGGYNGNDINQTTMGNFN